MVKINYVRNIIKDGQRGYYYIKTFFNEFNYYKVGITQTFMRLDKNNYLNIEDYKKPKARGMTK